MPAYSQSRRLDRRYMSRRQCSSQSASAEVARADRLQAASLTSPCARADTVENTQPRTCAAAGAGRRAGVVGGWQAGWCKQRDEGYRYI